MSRAFAPGESEDDEERLIVKAAVLPPGAPNYITPAGAEKLKVERERLIAAKAKLGESVEDKQRVKILDQKMAFLADRLNSVTILDPEKQAKDRVSFGATVTLGAQTFRIVGVDEVDLEKGWISWVSPLAKTLFEKRVGDTAVVGGKTLTIEKIA